MQLLAVLQPPPADSVARSVSGKLQSDLESPACGARVLFHMVPVGFWAMQEAKSAAAFHCLLLAATQDIEGSNLSQRHDSIPNTVRLPMLCFVQEAPTAEEHCSSSLLPHSLATCCWSLPQTSSSCCFQLPFLAKSAVLWIYSTLMLQFAVPNDLLGRVLEWALHSEHTVCLLLVFRQKL